MPGINAGDFRTLVVGPDVDEVVVFGRIPEKPAKINGQSGFATTTDLDAVLVDASVDLVDNCRCRMVLPLSAVVLLRV